MTYSPTTRHRLIASILLVVIAMFGAAGCQEDRDEGLKVLRVANWGGAQVDSDFMRLERAIREEFERAHPGVQVRFEQIPGPGQYAAKLLMMHVTGSVPDVAHLDASSAAVFIDNGVLQDLTPFIERDADFDLNDYFENVREIARRDKRLYAIPLDFTPMVMYYNKKLFDTAGVPYPRPGWTWDDFLATARRLTVFPEGSKAPTQYGFNFENQPPLWMMWIWNNGGDLLDPEGRRATGYFDSPESIAAVQFLVDLMTRYRVAPHLTESAAAGQDLFRAGQVAMDLKGHWMMIDYRADQMDFGVVGLPTNLPRRATVIYEAGLAVTARARYPDLAWEYIKFMTSKGVQVRRVASGLAVSGNREAAAEFAGNAVEDAFIEEVEYARAPWGARVERFPFIEDLVREMLEDILYSNGKVSVAKAMHETAKLIDAALAN